MTFWRIACLSFVTIILTLSLAFPVSAEDTGRHNSKSGTLEKILNRKVLKVGFAAFEPWTMKDKDDHYCGFEIDVAKRLASDMGGQVILVPTEWDKMISALINHKFDIIISGMNMTPERILAVHFSDPYEFNSMSIVANKNVPTGKMTRANYNNAQIGGPSHLSTLVDFNSPRITIGVRLGTTAESVANNYTPKAKVVTFKTDEDSIKAVLNGEISCLMASQPLPEMLVKKHPDKLYLPIKNGFAHEPSGFAVRKGDLEFLTYLNNWIRICTSNGWLQKRYQHWRKTTPWKKQIK